MENERWRQVKDIFLDALEVPAAERSVYVFERCGGDAAMKREVEKLIAAHFESEDFIELAAAELASIFQPHEAPPAPEQLGSYKIIREIDRGGMGAVYLAVRADEQYNKRVAIKVLRRGMDSEDVLRRFRQERQILAALEHPLIARLLDGGVSEDGRPYFVMEYVEGEPLDKYCDERGLSTEARLDLFRKVCAAVSYAHQNLIVHRDLKPSNILVTETGEPKLLDFGIAKFLNPELSPLTLAPTATFVRLMTPEYASPEQIRGRSVTTASDIYSLGVLLYKLLTGTLPYRFENSTPQEIERVVCETDPVRPSSVASGRRTAADEKSGAAQTAVKPKSDVRNPKLLRGDLDNIVLTALRKEPERRYKSVEKLSEDIERYLKGLPVSARPNTFWYRSSKFVGRHAVGVAAAALIVLSLIGGIVAAGWQARLARIERDRAQAAQVKAERINQFLAAALAYSDPSASVAGAHNRRDATINEMLDDFAPRIEIELAGEPDARASLQRTVGIAYASQLRYAEAARYLGAALETHLAIYGENHRETAYTRSGLALLQQAKGDYAGVKETLEKVIAVYRAQPPHDQVHIRVFAAALVSLGDTHWTRGDYRAAGAAYSEAMSVAVRLEGRNRETLADAKSGLGINRYALGDLDEATRLLREAVAEYRGLPHLRWKVPIALNHLAQVLTWSGAYDEALVLLRESEAISLEVWGEKDYGYARSLWLQVYALCLKGDCAAAEKTLIMTEDVSERNFPDNQVIKANNLAARSLVLGRLGRFAEAEQAGRRSIELYLTTMNRGANSIAIARMHLAESLAAQKKHDEAERVLIEAVKDSTEGQGKDHWRTKQLSGQLAALYETLGKSELARQYR